MIPALAGLAWFVPRLRLWKPLRVAALVIGVALLARPQLRLFQDGMDLWVLLDRSASTEELVERDVEEWLGLLENSRPHADDRMLLVDFADEVVPRTSAETLVYSGGRERTRLRLAVDAVTARTDPDRFSRIVAFTDGFSTEPLRDLGEKLAAAGIALDYRLVRDPGRVDFRIAGLELPPRAQIAEPFVLEIEVVGEGNAVVPLTVSRDGREVARADIDVVDGRGRMRFTDRVGASGSFRYEARITPAGDAVPGNNRAENWIEVTGGPRLLLVTAYPDDPVADVLARQGFDVERVTDPATLHVGRLSGAKAVVLNNVPAWEIPGEFLAALPFYVRSQGGGILMAGGKTSFGAGGFFESAIDPLLPVSMELRNEHRKLAIAMAVVMDRSGSMSAGVAGGATKMDLANEGTGRAIELLGAQDAIVVFAVDSEAHEIVPLQKVGPNRDRILNLVRRIESTGGGIFVYNGLDAAWTELRKTTVGQRHIILFSDAADSEQPGKYEQLVAEIVADGGSVSVIGLGTTADSDARLLEDIAKRGNGRIFFSDKPQELPNLFAQETVAVARSTFVTDPTPAVATGQWLEISAKSIDWPPAVDGYNLSYLRPQAASALDSGDEYEAPLVAFMNQGTGRSAAISFALGGEFSQSVRGWSGYGDFVQTMARWLMGDAVPPGIGVRHRIDGTLLTVDLLFDDEWQRRFAEAPPRLVLADPGGAPAAGDERGSGRELVWERIEPGRYTAREDLREGELVRGAIQVGKSVLPFGPVIVGSSTEWNFEPARLAELRATAELSGGGELLELGDAWRSPPVQRFSDVRAPLVILLLLLVLADALVTRMGWRMPTFAFAEALRARRSARDRALAKERQLAARDHRRRQLRVDETPGSSRRPPPVPAKPPADAPAASGSDPEARRSRFQRAKRR